MQLAGGDLLSFTSTRVSSNADANAHDIFEECAYDEQYYPSSSTWDLQCDTPLSGRHVSIRRAEGKLGRVPEQYLLMCEVQIYGYFGG